jgi:hypothetical protein
VLYLYRERLNVGKYRDHNVADLLLNKSFVGPYRGYEAYDPPIGVTFASLTIYKERACGVTLDGYAFPFFLMLHFTSNNYIMVGVEQLYVGVKMKAKRLNHHL